MGKLKLLERWKLYWNISQVGELIRRFFVMNFFDGVLTALGIILGFFVTIGQTGQSDTDRIELIILALITAIAIGISGFFGSRISESTEGKLKVIELKETLGLHEENGQNEEKKDNETDLLLSLGFFKSRKRSFKTYELQQALGLFDQQPSTVFQVSKKKLESIENVDDITKKPSHQKEIKQLALLSQVSRRSSSKNQKDDTLFEQSQRFASILAAIIDGISPFLGVIIVILPFTIPIEGENISMIHFYLSFILTGLVLFLLGYYLAKISRENKIFLGLKMIFAAGLTMVITLLLQNFVL